MTYHRKKLIKEFYWKPVFQRPKKINLDRLIKKFEKILIHSVKECIKDKKKIGFLMSGGLDSRYIAASLKKLDREPIAFCFGMKNSMDNKIAKEVCSRLNIDYKFYELNGDFINKMAKDIVHMGEGKMRMQDCHFIGWFDYIKQNFDLDVMLTGHFGGGLFGQRIPKKLYGLIPHNKLTNDFLIQYYRKDGKNLRKIFSDEILEKINNDNLEPIKKYFLEKNERDDVTELIDLFELEIQSRRYILQLFQFIDWYFDVRRPFMNNELIDFAINLPYEMRSRQLFYQKAIKQIFPNISDIIWEDTLCKPDSPYLKVLIQVSKRKILEMIREFLEKIVRDKIDLYKFDLLTYDYRPYANWMRSKENERYIKKILLDENSFCKKVFKSDYIDNLIKDHMDYKANNIFLLDLVNLELTYKEIFTENNS